MSTAEIYSPGLEGVIAGGPDGAEAWIRGALARKEKVMGLGQRVYKAGDVRAGHSQGICPSGSGGRADRTM